MFLEVVGISHDLYLTTKETGRGVLVHVHGVLVHVHTFCDVYVVTFATVSPRLRCHISSTLRSPFTVS